jgi:Peptidase family M23
VKFASLLFFLVLAHPAFAEDIQLSSPIACKIGVDCWLQQYVDHDAGVGTKDYSCGSQTYDGHDGTDIRLQDIKDSASVLAAAPGIVKAVRDSMDDKLVVSDADRAAIKNRECGNGVVIDHTGGWQTQYCHMRKSSIQVKVGDRVKRAAQLGKVGFSGMAAFPHVHLTVRRGGKIIDPFDTQNTSQCGLNQPVLWLEETRIQFKYANADLIGFGFSPTKVELSDLMTGQVADAAPARDWPALVAFGWAINLKTGDKISVSLEGPESISVQNSVTLNHNKAQYLLFSGKKPKNNLWPAGDYRGHFEVLRGATLVIAKDWRVTIK